MVWKFSKTKEYIFYLFVFSIPWQTRWIIRDPAVHGGVWEYGRVSLYGWDILLVLLLLLNWRGVAGEARRLWQAATSAQSNSGGRGLILSALLVANVFLVSTWALGSVVAFVWALRLLFAVLALWLLIRVLKPNVEHTLVALAAAGAVQALWALWQLVTQTTFANKWLGVAVHPFNQGGTSVVLTATGRWLRAYAGQVHPNVLGGLLAVTALATAWLYVEHVKCKNYHAKWYLLIYAIQLAGLFASFSRGAWLALFASLAVWWWRSTVARHMLRPVLLASVGVFLLLGTLWWRPVLGRLVGGSRLEQQSVDERVGEFQDSHQLLGQAWWQGLGVGSYTASLIARDSSQPSYAYQPVHNVPLLALLELGIAGFIILLVALGSRLRPFNLPAHLLLLPVLFTALFDHYWWTTPSMVVLAWLLVAMPLPIDESRP